MGILGVLTVIFIVLKLLNVIDWSWWLVFLPSFIAVTIYILQIVLAAVLTGFAKEVDKQNNKSSQLVRLMREK